jgi:pyruvate formate lyase activating enzyme
MRSARETRQRFTDAPRDDDRRALSATVLNIQRTSTEDGPGLRTTVFLKGCSLTCAWCHNPEAIARRPQVVWHRSRCIGSRECAAACPENALSRSDGAVFIDLTRCTACGDCVERCPSAALERLGSEWELDALIDEIAKDRGYFEKYGGGITISGGEPALQPTFVRALLKRCRSLGLHTAVDTCGMCSASALESLARHADMILYDLKGMDPVVHASHTGESNERILANLLRLARLIRESPNPPVLWIRTPLIPGATANDENISAIGAFIAEHLSDIVARWELCAFNNLAADKYERLAKRWLYDGTPLLTASELAHADAVARASGVDARIVCVTGRARVDCDAAGRASQSSAAAEPGARETRSAAEGESRGESDGTLR